MATHKGKKSKCPDCNGEGFLEHAHGLIRIPCGMCKGTGIMTKEVKVGGNRLKPNTRTRTRQANRSA